MPLPAADRATALDLISYIDASPSPWHAVANAEQEGGEQAGVADGKGGDRHRSQRPLRRRTMLQRVDEEQDEEAGREEDPVGVEQRAARGVGDGVIHEQGADRRGGHAGGAEWVHTLLRGDVEEFAGAERADQRDQRGKRPATQPDEADRERDRDGGKGNPFDQIGVHRHAQLLTRPKRRSRPWKSRRAA